MDTLSGGSYPGLALKTSNYKPNYLRIFQNSCAKKTAIGLLGTQGSGDSLGALVIATNDLFSSTILLRDLSRDATGGTTTANLNICYGVISCTDMQIFYAAVMNYYTVFATNRGIYYISAFPASGSSSTSNTKFYQAITGQSTLDNGASAALAGTVYLSSTANCLAASESYTFVVFSSTSALRNNLIYTTQTTIASNQWSTNIPISSISGIAATFQFVSAARFSPTSLNIYLLGIPATCTSVFTVSCSNNAVVVVHNTTKNTFTTSFTFPSTATTVTGVHCHANGIDCYIYGSELWHSIDGGNNWLQLFVFPTPDTVSKFESSHGKGNFILLTNSNNAYYGRAGNAEIVRVKTWNSKSTNLNEVVMDEMGNAFGLSLETVTAYSGTSSDYPMGFLKTITGQIRDSTSPYLKRVPIPVENLVGATDYSFADALAPVFIGQYRVQLFSKAALFQQYHVGMMIMLSTGGKAVINSVSSGGYVADCTIITNFVASTIPASSQSLTSGAAVGDVTAPLVSDTTSTATTSTLVLGAGSWYGSDIGKTVVANQGVFLITAVSSATSATAIVIRPPLTTVNNLGSGSWSVYDFRSYTEYSYSTNAAQSITTDADQLFETRSVADVRVLEAKMGERYRDLIEAADTVAKMKEASLSLQSLFAQLDQGCNSELVKQKIKAEEEKAKGTGDKTKQDRAATYPAAIQIKLLVDTPEQIWNSLENNSYLRASRLWQAANTINRNLQQSDSSTSKIPLTFPLVQRQWDTIKPFEAKILEKTKEHIKSVSISSQSVTESLCAIMLLERISPKHVYGTFLTQRKVAISETLKNFAKDATPIPALLTNLANILQITLFQVSIIFSPLESNPPTHSLLDTLITSLSQRPSSDSGSIAPNSLYSLYSEKSNMHVIFRHLPPAIQNHIPLFISGGPQNQLGKDFVKQSLDAWLVEVMKEIKSGVSDVLKHINTGSQLATIRESLLNSISEFEKADVGEEKQDWESVCVHLVDRKVSLWDEIFRGVFKELSLGVIESSFGALANQVDTVVFPLVQASQALDSEDSAVASFIWTAPSSKVVSGSNKVGTELLCRVQTSSLGDITESFEKCLASIKQDIMPLVTAGYSLKRRGSISPSKFLFDSQPKQEEIERDIDVFMKFFQDQYLKAIDNYQKSLLVQLKSISSQNTEVSMAQTVFIARVAKALAIKVKMLSVPTLRDDSTTTASSIVAKLRQRNVVKDSVSSTGLESSQLSLMDVHMAAMKVWITATCNQFESSLSEGLATEDWTHGTVSIHSKDESGKAQENKLKLPVHVSSFVIQSLFKITSELNRLNGFILEKPCLKILLHEIAHRIVSAYRNFLDNVLPTLQKPTEKAYIQILFDYDLPTTKQRKPRAKITISANSNVNSVGKENANNTSYSISGSVLSGVVGLVGAAANTAQMAGVSQSSLFGGAQSMFGALMGGGGATSTTSKGTGGVSSSGNSPKKP
ncbi:Golgi transport complex subunit 1 [Rhizoclosmatium sp. JEL0117]|nr:Golgi transport complex subunit 1 [Rhizoclosmatium sp. JEL0117]